MSFLNQLKNQAKALQGQHEQDLQGLAQNTAEAEAACRTVLFYFQDLAKQLTVIAPPGPRFSLDGKTPWPAMKLVEFQVDARRKRLRDKEVVDYIAMGWRVVPQVGDRVGGVVKVNFPPDLQRVESRLALGPVQHERKEIRDVEKNKLLAIQFEYVAETRGSVIVTPDHDRGTLAFRILNGEGFGVLTSTHRAPEVRSELLDELAKLVVSQPHRFA